MTMRSMTLTLTVQVQADLDTDEEHNETHVQLADVRHSIIGALSTPLKTEDDATATSEEFRTVMATEVTKLAVNFLQNRFSGEHKHKPPEVTQKGAMA